MLLVHPGGPFWKKKDLGAWSIPKGEHDASEAPEDAARREFLEETGVVAPALLVPLGSLRQRGGKVVTAFAAEGDCDPARIRSGLFAMEWPPRSGRMQEFPEVDRAEWFDLAAARDRILPSQLPFLDRLEGLHAAGALPPDS